MTKIICVNCRFHDESSEFHPPICRKYAPRPLAYNQHTVSKWPETDGDDWCGEAEPLEKPEHAARRLYDHEPHTNAGEPIPWDDLSEAWKKFYVDKAAATLGISREG